MTEAMERRRGAGLLPLQTHFRLLPYRCRKNDRSDGTPEGARVCRLSKHTPVSLPAAAVKMTAAMERPKGRGFTKSRFGGYGHMLESEIALVKGKLFLMKDTTVLILAAGDGKRMKSDIPSAPQGSRPRPLSTGLRRRRKRSSTESPSWYTAAGGSAVPDYLGDRCTYALQDKRLGSGHAVMMAEDL